MSDAHNSSGSISYGYEDPENVVPATKKKTTSPSTVKKGSAGSGGFRVSSLPADLRESVAKMNLDKNGDGELDAVEIGLVVESLTSTTKVNKFLKYIVGGLCIFAMLLVACVFGATIVAARLTKDTDVDSLTGIMYARQHGGSGGVSSTPTTMKTADVMFYSDDSSSATIMEMTNSQLKSLKEILFGDDQVKFQVKGYARSKDNTYTTVLVEGGTIIYDINGIASATGDAKILLDSAFGEQQEHEGSDDVDVRGRGRRYLALCMSSTASGSTSSGSTSSTTACFGSGHATGNTACTKFKPSIFLYPSPDGETTLYKCCGRYQDMDLTNDVATCQDP
jgi:hypothetical protein